MERLVTSRVVGACPVRGGGFTPLLSNGGGVGDVVGGVGEGEGVGEGVTGAGGGTTGGVGGGKGGGRGVGGLVVVFAVTKVWFEDTEVLFD